MIDLTGICLIMTNVQITEILDSIIVFENY